MKKIFLTLLLVIIASLAQAQTCPLNSSCTISSLASASTPLTGTELVPLVQGGVTKKAASSLFTNSSSPYSGGAVNITQPPYNASCNGSTDDSAAIALAIASGHPVYIPPSSAGCVANNITVPSYTSLLGANGPSYNIPGTRSRLIAKTGATKILNVNGATGVLLQGFDVDGNNGGSVNCISSGSFLMTTQNMNVRNCGNGGVGDIATITQGLLDYGTVFFGNTVSLINLVDSQLIGGSVSGGTSDGIYLPTGANDNSIVGVKIEFNTGYGIDCFECNRLAYVGGVSDSNSKAGLAVSGCGAVSVSGVNFRRNGSNATYGQNAHIYMNGACDNVAISGITTAHGTNDDGSGVDRPQVSILINAGTDTNLSITGNSLSGNTTATGIYYNAFPASAKIADNAGATPFFSGSYSSIPNGLAEINAMATNTVDYNQSFGVGTSALLAQNTSNSFSSAFGYQALKSLTSGLYNSAFGANAGDTLTSGQGNAFYGLNSGHGITTGSGNVAIGFQTMDAASAATSQNTMIGNQAGAALTGNSNTFIGYQVGQSAATSVTGAILIGTSSAIDTSTSNSLNIGGAVIATNLNTTPAVAMPGTLGVTGLTTLTGGANSAANITMTAANKGLVLKQGANGRVGTFVCNGATPVTVSNSSFAITDAVVISLNTVGGTVGAVPRLVTATGATGFNVNCTASDTSTYNYVLIGNAS